MSFIGKDLKEGIATATASIDGVSERLSTSISYLNAEVRETSRQVLAMSAVGIIAFGLISIVALTALMKAGKQ